MTSSLDEIRAHWANWAQSFGTDLRATSRTATIKSLEIDALIRNIKKFSQGRKKTLSMLEAGCGNGYNCMSLATAFPDFRIAGFDYIPEMVDAAIERRDQLKIPEDRLRFFQDDLQSPTGLNESFDIIVTVRCIINLNTDDLQIQAIDRLCQALKKDGILLMIENNDVTYGRQNAAREAAGLPIRHPADFNHFMNERLLFDQLARLGFKAETEDFASLHDIALYILTPMINGGNIDYNHPIVQAATTLSLSLNQKMSNAVGSFGQNRLYICQRLS